MKDVINISIDGDKIVMRAIRNPREGWEKSFKRMNENADDRLLIIDFFEDENIEVYY
ncbi:MAG: hypothetical protein K9I48_06665 [Sphingobacteriales bacterium]|jgi:antitoxin MazE|nr:hypothetical protein [Sphingobacteriales bacterium]